MTFGADLATLFGAAMGAIHWVYMDLTLVYNIKRELMGIVSDGLEHE